MEREKSTLKKATALLMAEEHELDQLRSEEPVDLLCSVFEVTRSCYYAYCRKRRIPDVERLVLRSRVNELFTQSRSAAGSRSVMFMMRDLRDCLSKPYSLNGVKIDFISTSIGIALYPQHADAPEALINAADQAMYKAKHQRNSVFCARPKQARRRLEAVAGLPSAFPRLLEGSRCTPLMPIWTGWFRSYAS